VPEKSLHNQLKNWYTKPGDRVEEPLDGYIVDIIREDLIIEIQTSNFSVIKPKLRVLTKEYKVRLIYPIPHIKWIIKLDKHGEQISKRRSPKKGRIEEVFKELVYIPRLLEHPNLELEVLLVNMAEHRVNNSQGRWRRKWRVLDRNLVNVIESQKFTSPTDFLKLIPDSLPHRFTARDFSKALKLHIRLARKMVYCLRIMGLIDLKGKRNKANLYSWELSSKL
jgi:hypothetical protein